MNRWSTSDRVHNDRISPADKSFQDVPPIFHFTHIIKSKTSQIKAQFCFHLHMFNKILHFGAPILCN